MKSLAEVLWYTQTVFLSKQVLTIVTARLEPSVADSLGTSGWNMPNRAFKRASIPLKAVFTKGTHILQYCCLA